MMEGRRGFGGGGEPRLGHHLSVNDVKFVAATLQGRALTWWNSQVATLGLEVVNAKFGMYDIMMREVFVARGNIKNGVSCGHLRVNDSYISAYTKRFNEFESYYCPLMVLRGKRRKWRHTYVAW
ncbi:hypothetical protein Tco_1238844 [Tanacetum coccineum]